MRAGGALIRPPFAWRSGFGPALREALLFAALPALVLVAAWSASTPGVQLGNFLANNGQLDRLGGFLTTTSLRWLGPAVATLALAVAVGGRLAGELASGGERTDAASGSSREGSLARFVAARVAAFGAAALILDLLALPVAVLAGLAVAVAVLDAPAGTVLATMFADATWVDLVGSLVRAGLCGLLIGLVCCYAGLEAAGRAESGRAVRDALVGSLIVIAFVSLVFGTYTLAAFPDLRFTR